MDCSHPLAPQPPDRILPWHLRSDSSFTRSERSHQQQTHCLQQWENNTSILTNRKRQGAGNIVEFVCVDIHYQRGAAKSVISISRVHLYVRVKAFKSQQQRSYLTNVLDPTTKSANRLSPFWTMLTSSNKVSVFRVNLPSFNVRCVFYAMNLNLLCRSIVVSLVRLNGRQKAVVNTSSIDNKKHSCCLCCRCCGSTAALSRP